MLALPAVLLLCAAGIVCLTPLTLYLFWLAHVNRRDRPTVVSGSWDFVALVAGLAGFLLCGGLAFSAFAAQTSPFAGGGFANVFRARAAANLTWLLVTGGYAALVFAGVWFGVRGRRRTLSVYNVELGHAEAAVKEVFARLGLNATRFGNLWSDGRGLVEVVPFHALRHVSVRLLPADPRLCEELDRQFRAAVPAQPPADNPAAGWITTAAVSSFVGVLCFVFLVFVAVFTNRV